eukprot:GHVU01147757.1.p1 GENE.GHVU01147757.1~~GHVU01147757.1.p1  ORF type:complete len:277 (-),score=56.89 GHVU01147757.1:640-1470(-)
MGERSKRRRDESSDSDLSSSDSSSASERRRSRKHSRRHSRSVSSSSSSKRGRKSKENRRKDKVSVDKKKDKKKHKSKSKSRDKDGEEKKRKHKSKDKGRKHKKSKSGPQKIAWGKFGIIQECDMYLKKQEFQQWLMDIKNISMEGLSQMEEKKHFASYMEDYNTATLAHKKYYDLPAYEREKVIKEAMKCPKDEDEPEHNGTFDDEAQRKREIMRLREQRKVQEQRETYEAMRTDQELIESMKHQQDLRLKMQVLFKTGRTAEAEKLKRILEPDDK